MRTKKVLLFILLFIVSFVLVYGIYLYYNRKDLQDIFVPRVEQIEQVHIKIKGDTALAQLGLRVQNDGFFKQNIDSLIYHISFDTLTLLSREQDLDVQLLPGVVDTLQIPVALPFKRLFGRIKEIQDRDSVDITVDARIVYSTIFGRASVPNKKLTRIAVPIPPKFELERLEYLHRDHKTFYFKAHLKMKNPGKIDLVVSGMKYRMVVEDLFVAEGAYPNVITVKPRSVITEALPIEVKFKKLAKTAWKVVTDNDMVGYKIKISGHMQAKDQDEKTSIEIEKTGKLELKK